MEGWLGKERMTEIVNSDSFVCHETISDANSQKQCAGHMILLKEHNLFYRMAHFYNKDLHLKGEELIFKNREACISHHNTENH